MTFHSCSRAAVMPLVQSPNCAKLPPDSDGVSVRNDVHEQQSLLKLAFVNGEKREARTNESRMLLLEGIHDSAVKLLNDAGYTNISRLQQALEGDVLHEQLAGVSVLGVRSRTKLNGQAIAAFDQLLAIGCFSVGTNQVDLEAARLRGIPVFNAPFANTRSVAELVIGEIIMLFRQVFSRSMAAHSGAWRKCAAGSREVRGKTLGIVGYGNIGGQLSLLAEAIGMKVIYFDIVQKLRQGNAARAKSLMDLLRQSDVVSLHVPETPLTHCMIGRTQLSAMRKGSYLINNSRGTVVDLEALAGELRSGRLGGAAIDVFPIEPSSNADVLITPLRGLPNVILTPHIGGSTEEAQEAIGQEVAQKLIDYLALGSTIGAVNFPHLQLPPRACAGLRFIHAHQRIAGMNERLFDIFRRHHIRVAAHFCETDDEIGYVIMDVEDMEVSRTAILNEINALEGTIRARFV